MTTGLLPTALRRAVQHALRHANDMAPIQRVSVVGGGSISRVLRVDTDQHAYLLKWHTDAPPAMFTSEAHGLRLLADSRTLRVPTVIAAYDTMPEHPAFLLIEWIESVGDTTSRHIQAALGEKLARMHMHSATAFGLDHNNYIGRTPQYNGWYDDWVAFFRERRLQPQIELALAEGNLSFQRARRLDRIQADLDTLLAHVPRHPALLHGDLWSGNVVADARKHPVLVDPAVYYGDREAELAFTELFGGFTADFYRAYQATYPLDAGYADRRDLYNIYHLLNHVNLFGESYGEMLDRAIAKYA